MPSCGFGGNRTRSLRDPERIGGVVRREAVDEERLYFFRIPFLAREKKRETIGGSGEKSLDVVFRLEDPGRTHCFASKDDSQPEAREIDIGYPDGIFEKRSTGGRRRGPHCEEYPPAAFPACHSPRENLAQLHRGDGFRRRLPRRNHENQSVRSCRAGRPLLVAGLERQDGGQGPARRDFQKATATCRRTRRSNSAELARCDRKSSLRTSLFVASHRTPAAQARWSLTSLR